MEIKKVVNLSEDEFNKLVEAGKVARALSTGLAEHEFDSVSEATVNVLVALKEVIETILV